MQTVRITKGFQQFMKGEIVTVGGGVADAWIRRGVAEPMPAAPKPARTAPVIETAALESVAETADRTPRRRRSR